MEVVKLAFEFLILNASRTSEVLLAEKSEIDHKEALWVIPAERIKEKREHRIPLAVRSVEIVKRASELAGESSFLFPAPQRRASMPIKPLSNMVFLKILERMGLEVTAHGFRSSFRDWAAETTSFPREVAEMALAHKIKDKVEAAYRRGDLLEKRRELMEAWAAYCCTPAP